MINPAQITNYHLSQWESEEVLLFWVCAAGKNATTAARGLQRVLKEGHDTFGHTGQTVWRPFDVVRSLGRRKLPWALKRNGIGCYRHKARTMWELANSGFNLKTCTVEDLEQIYGIGMKTSRCFMIHSRKDAEYAALDTHILKYMADQGYDVPNSTPGRKKYLELEKQFLALAKKSGKTLAEFDLDLWNEYKVPSWRRSSSATVARNDPARSRTFPKRKGRAAALRRSEPRTCRDGGVKSNGQESLRDRLWGRRELK